jgi:hypothetical protein
MTNLRVVLKLEDKAAASTSISQVGTVNKTFESDACASGCMITTSFEHCEPDMQDTQAVQ